MDMPGEGERRHKSWSLSRPSLSLDILEATPCPQVPLEALATLSAKRRRKDSEDSQGISEGLGRGWGGGEKQVRKG